MWLDILTALLTALLLGGLDRLLAFTVHAFPSLG
jgi:hypothetical protein